LYDDPAKRALLKPEIQWEIEGALDMPAERVHAAGKARSDWFRTLFALFDRYDFLALPTAQVFRSRKILIGPSRSRIARWTPTTAGWRW
jgi:amidase